jgi:hypothetical protein
MVKRKPSGETPAVFFFSIVHILFTKYVYFCSHLGSKIFNVERDKPPAEKQKRETKRRNKK